MAYFAPYIDETGFHYSTKQDKTDYLVEAMKAIYGQDIYLEPDSQDYEFLSVFSLMLQDNEQMMQAVYDSYSPKKAIGISLDHTVKQNGIRRKSASFSTVQLLLTGNIGSVISKGIVRDSSGVRWFLDDETIIFTATTITVSATCERIGAVPALPNSILGIVTPTKGWLGVTNSEPAVMGTPIETDYELRTRQSKSVAIPARNMVDSLYAGIMSLDNVRDCIPYDNDTSQTDINGIPSHSVACVVEGGSDSEVAQMIYLKKGPGGGTYGNITVPVSTITGLPIDIQFSRPSQVIVDIRVSIAPASLFTSRTEQAIRDRIAEYFYYIDIGADILRSSIVTVISQAISDIYRPEFRINLPILTARDGEQVLDADTEIVFNEKAILGTLTLLGI